MATIKFTKARRPDGDPPSDDDDKYDCVIVDEKPSITSLSQVSSSSDVSNWTSWFLAGTNQVKLAPSFLLNATTVEITIINDTNCILNISLKTIAPLFFENRLLPGHCVIKRVPRFVYTVEARVWTGNNDYSLVNETIIPGTFLALTALSFAASTASRTALVLSRSPAWVSRALKVGRPLFQIGRAVFATRVSKEVLSSLVSGAAIRSHGRNCTRKKTFAIRGGPPVNIIEEGGLTHQYIELAEQFEGFYICEPTEELGDGSD